ncbi:MAG: asparagine synthase (glutamine-hydrolyzing), partial [Anaerolineales bacterium]|nr:asparagine synthase (glutamine-hydrolyzing) [Anaerolineales bacterium]
MCGITGFWQLKGNNKELLKDTIIKMTKTFTHRGPDDSGFYINKETGIALGHRRLSILDLSPKGHQPMESFSGRHVIVYNGEVYNYKELRKEIENDFNIKFKSSSDTEVVLAGFEVWGIEETLKRLNGMFAFALWDKKEKKLYLARDRIGIKPLYYGVQNGILFFASELKAIRANRFFKPKINRNALALFFRHNYIPAAYSIYKNVKKLEPAHYAVIDRNLNINIQCYWDIKRITKEGIKNPIDLLEKDAVFELERLLLDSVKKRMIADVPLGAFLSGGIDSSTVVALMQAQSNISVKTFTIGFYEDNYNEAKFAKDVTKHLGTDHTELYVTPKETMDVIPKLPDMYDEPFSDSSQIPTFLVSQLTRRYVTVSLSGDGGDETFGGYNRYFWADNIWEKINFMPLILRSQITKIISLFSPEFIDNFFKTIEVIVPEKFKQTLYGDKLHKLSEILTSRSPDEIYKRLISHWKSPETLVLNSIEPKIIIDDFFRIKNLIPEFKDRMMFFDLMTYLPDDILTKVDRASMSVSLEARVPILDHRIVEFSKRLPLSFKIKNGKSKWILRQVLYKYVPKELVERPKMGFGVPIDNWIRDPLRDWAEDLLDEKKI